MVNKKAASDSFEYRQTIDGSAIIPVRTESRKDVVYTGEVWFKALSVYLNALLMTSELNESLQPEKDEKRKRFKKTICYRKLTTVERW
jgi:hypothetical protein